MSHKITTDLLGHTLEVWFKLDADGNPEPEETYLVIGDREMLPPMERISIDWSELDEIGIQRLTPYGRALAVGNFKLASEIREHRKGTGAAPHEYVTIADLLMEQANDKAGDWLNDEREDAIERRAG